MRDATGAEVRLDHGKAAASGHADWHPAGLAAYGGGRDRISLQRYIEEWTLRPNRAGIRGLSAITAGMAACQARPGWVAVMGVAAVSDTVPPRAQGHPVLA